VTELTGRVASLDGISAADDDAVLANGCQHVYHSQSSAIRDAARLFRDSDYHLEHITCLDLRSDEGGGLRLSYQFNVHGTSDRHLLLVDLAPAAHAPTIVDIFRGADWYEREAFDMHGVVIDDHPDLRRLLMPEDYTGHPLLKDFTDADPERHIMAAPMSEEEEGDG